MEISLEELEDFANDFVARLPKQKSGQAHIVALHGELGAGKTTFVQKVARALGIRSSVTSPTFVILQGYPISAQPFRRLIHTDAYRLEDEKKDTIRWKEYAENPENLIFVEWPEYVPGGVPEHAEHLYFTVTGEHTRDITRGKTSKNNA